MLSALAEAVAVGRMEYEAAERRRKEAEAEVAKAESVVTAAETAHESLRADAIAGKPITADQLGAALHKIAGAKSLVEIRQSAITAHEAEMEAVLASVVTAMRTAANARIKVLRSDEALLRGRIAELHKVLEATFRQVNSLEYNALNFATRQTVLTPYTAERAIRGDFPLTEIEGPAP